jgi:hypothetical protein
MRDNGVMTDIDFDGIVADWQDMGEVWAEFAPDRPAEPSLFDAMRKALEAANQVPEPDDFGTGVFGTVAGGALLLKFPPSEESVRRWLGVFARGMSAAG